MLCRCQGIDFSGNAQQMTSEKSPDARQRSEGRQPTPDVVFVGAGINTLACALLLTKAGCRVLVLERNETPGGAVRTLELTLPGFRHELGAANLNPFIGSTLYQKFGPALAEKGVTFLSAHRSSGLLLPGDDIISLTTDRETNLRTISEFSQGDADAWQAWTAAFEQCAPHLFRILGTQPGVADPLDQIASKAKGISEPQRVLLREIMLNSLRETLTARFESNALQTMIAAWGLHFDYAPDIACGAWYPFIETNLIQQSGATLVKGGAGRLTEALADLITDHGGEIRLGQTVEAILVERGKAVGVRLSSGEAVRAGHAVVAGVTPSALLKMVGADLPPTEARMARHYRYGPGALLIHLALSAPPDWKAQAARDCYYIHNGNSLDHLAAVYQQAVAGQLSDEPFFCINQPSAYDPTIAPAGKQVMRVFVRAVPAVIRSDAAGTIRGDTWTEAVKGAFADRVLDRIEEYAPGLRDRILCKTIQSPLDLEAMNPNLVDGDNNAGSMQIGQFYGGRPFTGTTDHRLPIDALYLCGAATWPGGGSNPVSGEIVAQQIREDCL